MAVVCMPNRRTCTVEKPSQKNRPPTRRSRRRKLIQMGFATKNRDFLTRGGLYILYSFVSFSRNLSRDTWFCFVLLRHRLFTLFCFSIFLVSMSGWLPNPCLQTLASWCSLRLVQVCSNPAVKTLRKRRNDPRNHPRKHSI